MTIHEHSDKNFNKAPTTQVAFKHKVRVYYEDTDAGGIVYHARYLYFLERARTEWLRSFGFNQSELNEQGTSFVIRDINVKYLKPARLDDELIIETQIESVKHASLKMQQSIYLLESADSQTNTKQKMLVAQVGIACLDAHSLKPKALPKTIKNAVIQK